jgi:predicted porin
MQKKIIALAIAAAFSAPAFADTTVYGLVDVAVARASGDGQKSDMQVVSGGLAGSRLGVNSSEDLGNGMKALVNLEYSLDVGKSDGIGNARQEMLAVAGGFGTVATGYLQTTGYDFGKSFDPTAGSTVSPLDNITAGAGFFIGTNAGLNRAPRALAYISPDMSGLTLAVNYSTDATGGLGDLGKADTATALKTTAMLLSANYKAGPLAVGAVYAALNDTTSGANNTSEMAFGASYDLEMVKLFATYQTQKLDNAAGSANTAMSLSAAAPVTSTGSVVFTYATTKLNHATAAMATYGYAVTAGADISNAEAKASGMTLAWVQGLSKTTTFYAAYSRMSNGSDVNNFSVDKNGLVGATLAANTLAAGGSSSMLAVGLSKKF